MYRLNFHSAINMERIAWTKDLALSDIFSDGLDESSVVADTFLLNNGDRPTATYDDDDEELEEEELAAEEEAELLRARDAFRPEVVCRLRSTTKHWKDITVTSAAGSGKFEEDSSMDRNVKFCSTFWDTVSCWPITAAGQMAVLPCPDEFEDEPLNTSGFATRYCQRNGTWEGRANYSQCIPTMATNNTTPAPSSSTAHLTYDVNIHSYASLIIFHVGFTISDVALFVALTIFLSFRSLRCLRNRIHCHLMSALLAKNLLWLKMSVALPVIIKDHPTNDFLQIGCRLSVTLFNYCQLAGFFWMLAEGLYVQMRLTRFSAIAIASDYPICRYVLLAWGSPVIIMVVWVVVKLLYEDSTCWLPEKNSYYDYIHIGPSLAVLLVNMVLLVLILRALLTKLTSAQVHSQHSQLQKFRKTARATVVLMPLLGITYILFLIHPSTENTISKHIFIYFNVVLQSHQGFFVAVFYCFLNDQARKAVVERVRRWRDLRGMTSSSVVETTPMRSVLTSIRKWKPSPVSSIRGDDHETARADSICPGEILKSTTEPDSYERKCLSSDCDRCDKPEVVHLVPTC